MNDYFKTSLNKFTSDVVAGDAIRRLADKGMTVSEISDNLTYPAPLETIRNAVWQYYLSSGIIRLDEPKSNDTKATQTEYICERNSYGRLSYRKIETKIADKPMKYVLCDFGLRLYNDKIEFEKSLIKLDKKDRDYILGLPWPPEIVYHINDERMIRIIGRLSG